MPATAASGRGAALRGGGGLRHRAGMSAHRHVLERAAACSDAGAPAALALVVETEGSTYARRGAMALFGASGHEAGWLSGGCLEPRIAQRAGEVIATALLDWMEIDTRDDADLLSGSTPGCRGRLRIALLPLHALPGWSAPVRAWLRRDGVLQVSIATDGAVQLRSGASASAWTLPAAAPPWSPGESLLLQLPPPPAVMVFGAGPETPVLLPLLRQLGWMTRLVERRPRWRGTAPGLADEVLDSRPPQRHGWPTGFAATRRW